MQPIYTVLHQLVELALLSGLQHNLELSSALTVNYLSLNLTEPQVFVISLQLNLHAFSQLVLYRKGAFGLAIDENCTKVDYLRTSLDLTQFFHCELVQNLLLLLMRLGPFGVNFLNNRLRVWLKITLT